MRWASALLLGCVGLAACDFNVSGVGDAGVSGPDLAVAADLAPGGGPDMVAVDCNSCPAGCDTTMTPLQCKHLVPTGPVVSSDFGQPGLTAVSVGSDIVVNTDTGAITGGMTRAAGSGVVAGVGFRVAAQTSGPSVGVFSVAGLTVAKAATITFTGANAFALASSGPLMIHGTIDGGAKLSTPGPGGFPGGTVTSPTGGGLGGGTPGEAGTTSDSGGGGGGYGDSGGQGSAGLDEPFSAGGGIFGDLTAVDFVLVGGSGGGLGGGNIVAPPAYPQGGAGGGALQLSIDGDIAVDGVVTVGGGGGYTGYGGNGGGAGGAIVLEGAHIALATGSVLAANGGGGGAAGGGMVSSGDNGGPTTAPARGGGGFTPFGGFGGDGGASNGHPGLHYTQGVNAKLTDMRTDGGGGGGGCGRIQLRALDKGIDDQSIAVTPDLSDTNSAGDHLTDYGLATFQ